MRDRWTEESAPRKTSASSDATRSAISDTVRAQRRRAGPATPCGPTLTAPTSKREGVEAVLLLSGVLSRRTTANRPRLSSHAVWSAACLHDVADAELVAQQDQQDFAGERDPQPGERAVPCLETSRHAGWLAPALCACSCFKNNSGVFCFENSDVLMYTINSYHLPW